MNKIRQIFAYMRHCLTAWNTTGEGIHSPYLFAIVRLIMRDENSYYCFADIERRREMLLACEDTLDVVDFGSQGSTEGTHVSRRVCDIAKNHLERPKVAQLLFRLVLFMQQNEKRPLQIMELGTSLGITTSYLAAADSRNNVVTIEGSEAVLHVAQGIWKTLKLENIEWQQGNIDDTLLYYIYSKQSTIHTASADRKNNQQLSIDIAYIDANHTYEATKRYTDYLLPLISTNGMLILDDIHYSEEMERAWNELKADERVTTTMDLYHIGIAFINPCFLKRHYRIRI